LNANNGKIKWKLNLPKPVARRGLTYSSGNLFVPTGSGVFALDAKTGNLKNDLGSKGKFGNDLSLLPPVVFKGQLISASYTGTIQSWDINTGIMLWKTSLVTKGVTPRLWSGITYDEETKKIFVVTSNRGWYFTNGTGDGADYSCSLVAINVENGK